MIKLFITLANEPTGPMSGEYYSKSYSIIGFAISSNGDIIIIIELQNKYN